MEPGSSCGSSWASSTTVALLVMLGFLVRHVILLGRTAGRMQERAPADRRRDWPPSRREPPTRRRACRGGRRPQRPARRKDPPIESLPGAVPNPMLNVGPLELLVVLAVALIVVGPERLPELARSVGRVLRQFREVQDEVRNMVSSGVDDDMRQAAVGVQEGHRRHHAGHRREGRGPTGGADASETRPPPLRSRGPRLPSTTPGEVGGPPADRLVEEARGRTPTGWSRMRPPTGPSPGRRRARDPASAMRALPRWRRKSPEEREGAMSLIDHLKELRHRTGDLHLGPARGARSSACSCTDPAMRADQEPVLRLPPRPPRQGSVRAARDARSSSSERSTGS